MGGPLGGDVASWVDEGVVHSLNATTTRSVSRVDHLHADLLLACHGGVSRNADFGGAASPQQQDLRLHLEFRCPPRRSLGTTFSACMGRGVAKQEEKARRLKAIEDSMIEADAKTREGHAMPSASYDLSQRYAFCFV